MTDPNPLLPMLEWLTSQPMRLEAEAKVYVEKVKHDESRTTHFSGIMGQAVRHATWDDVSAGPEATTGRLYPLFRDRAEAK